MTLRPVDQAPERFGRQFILTREASDVPAGWRRHTLAGWTLGTHPSLPVLDHDRGWLLGWPTLRGDLLTGAPDLPPVSDPGFEDALYELAAAWALILPGEGRVYLDPIATVPVLYCEARQTVASTTALIPNEAPTEFDESLAAVLRVRERGKYYPLGLTARRGCTRLMANHYLDLSTWRAVRHWPVGAPATRYTAEEVADAALPLARECIGALIATGRGVRMGLTSGRDSRVILACARPWAERLSTFTYHIPEKYRARDARTARALAARFGLRHREYPLIEADEAELELWQERVGHEAAGRSWKLVATDRSIEPESFVINGFLGELARGYWWGDGEGPETPLTRALLLSRLRVKPSPQLEAAAEAWLQGVPPGTDTLVALSLAYLEGRMGTWGSVSFLGHADASPQIVPLAQRRIVDGIVHMRPEEHREGRLTEAVVARAWPELAEVPYNSDTGLPAVLNAIGGVRRQLVSAVYRRYKAR